MPTPSKRIQVLLRRPIQERLEEFAEQEGLSSSKAVARLVEEAMAARGLLSSPDPATRVFYDSLQKKAAKADLEQEAAAQRNFTVTQNTAQQAPVSQPSDDDADDMTELLKMAKKLKALKEAGIL